MEKVFCLASVLASFAIAAPAFAATQIVAGRYTELHYVTAASVNGAGSCLEPVGAYYTTVIYYPGPAKKGFTEWAMYNTSTLLGNEIITYPVTPAPGVFTWSGTFTSTFVPGGSPKKGKFNATETVTDAHSAVGTTTLVYTTEAGGTCTTTIQLNQVYTGK